MTIRPTRVLLTLAILFVAIQVVPFGRAHTNPPVVQEPAWDSADTRALVKATCFDCHSNETRWPWYSSMAPTSWLVQHDVDAARRHLNFSEWNREQRHARDAAEQVRTGEMPMAIYTLMHGDARLSEADRVRLAASLEAMFGKAEPRPAR